MLRDIAFPAQRIRMVKPHLVLVFWFVILHSSLLLWDFKHPKAFMNCDRAYTRLNAIKSITSAIGASDKGILQVLATHGIIGDYLFHAILYGTGGKALVIAAQILLCGLACFAVSWLVHIITGSLPAASAATLLYMHLPYSLIYPHMLCSEALFSPFMLLSFAALAIHFMQKQKGLSSLILSALLVGLASLIRPIALLWPFVVVLICWIFAKKPINKLSFYLLTALSPILVWMSIMQFASGEFSMGRSGHDLQHNLYGRVEYITRAMPPDVAEEVRINVLNASPMPKQLSLSSYMGFITAHPMAALNHFKNDLIAFSAKLGIEAVLLDYIDCAPDFRSSIRTHGSTWRRDIDKHGILRIIRDIFQRQPLISSATMLGSMLMLALWIGFFACSLRFLRERQTIDRHLTTLVLLLALLPPYIFATSTLANNVQSRHRAPAEFSLVILAIASLCGVSKKFGSGKIRLWHRVDG